MKFHLTKNICKKWMIYGGLIYWLKKKKDLKKANKDKILKKQTHLNITKNWLKIVFL